MRGREKTSRLEGGGIDVYQESSNGNCIEGRNI